MLPFIPSFNQVQPQGGTGSIPPQVILSDPRLLNSSNFGSNLNPQFPSSSCPQQQNPSHSHQFPAPVPFPLDYSNTHLSSLQTNVASMPSRPPSVPFCFPNVNPSQQHQLPNLFQNGNSLGSNPQADLCNALQNLSQFAALQPNGQVLMHNLAQSLNQIMAPQMPNYGQTMFLPPRGQFCSQHPHQNLNQNAAGQFMLQNPGNLNQMLPMQCSSNPMDPTRVVPFSNSPCSNPILPHQNQRMHNSGPQSGGIPFSNSPCSNPMLPLQNQNMHTSSSQSGGILFSNSPCPNPMFLHQNKSTHTSGPQNGGVMNGNSNNGTVSNGCVQHGNQNFNVSTPSNMTQNAAQKPPSFSQSQKDHVEDGRNRNSNLNQGNPMIEDFKRNPYGSRKGKLPHMKFQKFQDNHSGNTKGNFRPNTRNVGKVHPNLGAGKMHHTKFSKKPMLESKRPVLPVTYTEVEIQKWREERKKNFPTKSNLEKILTDKQTDGEDLNRTTKVRRQQLKEILAKQAELGVEVAELPPNYLSDSENHVGENHDDRGGHRERGRFRNKFDKKGRHGGRNNQHMKKQKVGNEGSAHPVPYTRKPTLLEKLLSTDVKRDKSHLLQVFRFMVLNSFFKDWPEKPLEYPFITTKDQGVKNEISSGKCSLDEGVAAGGSRIVELEHENNDQNIVDEEDVDNQIDTKGGIQKVTFQEELEETEEEEGEITD